MEHQLVKALEDRLTRVLAQVMEQEFRPPLPLAPSQHTLHLMAKAAVTVYEATVASKRPRDQD